jgi:4-hydroxy-tetrahydrodipicolinate synthase
MQTTKTTGLKGPLPREGVLVALAIPTDAHGHLMKRALAAHLAWLRTCGVHGIWALGSAGEFVRFTVEERKAILEFIAEAAAPLPVLANISDIRPQAVAELGRFARRLKLPGVAVMPPHFYPVSAADQLAFFERAAAAAQLPVFLYNFPELTGNRIAIETVAAFADRAPLAGIKQSGTEFTYHEALIALGREKNFAVFTGADARLPEALAIGAAGCIGGLVNFVPEYVVEQFRICRQGRPGDPAPLAEHMREVRKWADGLKLPLNIAAGMEARGLEPGHPKMIVSDSSAAVYGQIVAGLRARFTEWNLPSAARA